MNYNVLDLFCGAGGLSLGFKMAGFNIVGGVDFDQAAIDTHALNFEDGFHFCGDISTLENEYILGKFEGKVDVVIGGPPCQGFSTANMWQKDHKEDDRNKLFYEFIRFVKLLKPKAFVMENVRGILTKDNGHVREAMLEIMSELGYKVDVKVLTASDYGVPQKRMRAFFVGINEKIGDTFDFDTLQKKAKVTVENAISDIYKLEKITKNSTVEDKFNLDQETIGMYQSLMRKNSSDILHNHNIKYPNDIVQVRMAFVPEGGNWRDVPEHLWDNVRTNRHSSAYRRLDSQDVSITIDTGHMNYFHPKYDRVPTVRESARIQSFPDDFIFTGGQGAQFRQVGNAVPPLLSKAIASALKPYLDGAL
ncbi:DNA (cytosine-5-)-methyltransferase [Aquibacillus halophilus]|uniref:Cytosine-specific methyltransferase n=1 Tax=Aquibacillus halophilus TaxID=930132 RepID=A0A6A8DCH5_9BACI|nr:DNA cytosine methyltransferase [Aquibacillus halophilus]MRH41579.1 DNA (cytosine-5-)-methyltransferase [Aquibacillus halophilus]